MSQTNILITGCTLVPMEGELRYFEGSIGISGNRIAFVEPKGSSVIETFRHEAAKSQLTEIDGTGMAAMPGLINTHNHVSMTLLRGYADDMSLMSWLRDKVWPFEAMQTRDDIKTGATLGIAEMLLGGTTTFVDMYKMEEAVAEAVTQSGIRAVLSITVADKWRDKFEQDFKTILERYGLPGSDLLRFMIAPHAPYTNSETTLARVKELCVEYGMGVNIHLAETQDEIRIINERYGKTPVEYLDDLGLLDSHTLAVHCVWLTDSDIETLARRGVSVAHCPESNMKLASGVSPLKKMMAAGINVSLGTDGSSSNNDLDMWSEMRSASFLQKVTNLDPLTLPAYQMVEMATIAGAKAIGMEGKLGVLKVGALADIILVDLQKPHLYPQHDLIANLAYSAKSSDVDTVIIDGKIVVQSGKLLTLDAKTLCRQTQQSVQEIIGRIED